MRTHVVIGAVAMVVGLGMGLGARVHAHTFMPLPGTPLKDAPAGTVAAPIARAIGQLEAQGRSYGHWRKQLVTAEALSRKRRG